MDTSEEKGDGYERGMSIAEDLEKDKSHLVHSPGGSGQRTEEPKICSEWDS